MNEGRHFRLDAAAIASLPPDALERRAAEAHARSCFDCAQALQPGRKLLELIEANLDGPALSPDILRAVSKQVRRRAALEVVGPAMGGALVLGMILAVLGRHPGEGARWVAAGSLASVATGLCWLAASGRIAIRSTLVIAALASIIFAVAFAGAGPIATSLGVVCVALEWIPALTGIAALLAFGQAPLLRDRWRSLAPLATSGLIAQAALIVRCPERMGAVHVLLFHSGGILVLCALYAILVPRLARPGAS
jgi:hypothetical protein